MGSLLSHETMIDRNKVSILETGFKSQVYISRGQDRCRSRNRGQDKRYGGQRDGREEHEDNKNFNNNQRFDK